MAVRVPELPPGRLVDIGDGSMFVREVAGPPGAPVLMLLHGMGATADINWFPSYWPLGERYRVIAPDLRGHGRTEIDADAFSLVDCTEDVARLAHALELGSFIAVGYSMGTIVAQLLWRDHRSLVDGLVLCAGSRDFRGGLHERFLYAVYPAAALFVRVASPEVARVAGKLLGAPGAATVWREWIRSEVALNRPRTLIQVASEMAHFSSREWVPDIDVPTSVVVTARDRLVPPRRQRKLAEAIAGAACFEVHGDHFVCTEDPSVFLGPLIAACSSVVDRVGLDGDDPFLSEEAG